MMTLANPVGALVETFNDQPAVVGGCDFATAKNGYMGGIIRNNGDATATITIKNVTGLDSATNYLDYIPGLQGLGDVPWTTGPLSNITQTYEWTWPLPGPRP
jgi:hypothetical protein